ncbi:hypothetical protein CPB84DRAFT_169310 [Gymnopilus junonius]|uniref:HAM1-like N-terminal domain-containing protein n=1 Tax=Gymnopilus junonius TaxID=109634 RepID=A0A9P5NW29_GYMJU|nr:hypothetical protein CPB84DRAFT_169310 [Gymnopilus junonius]
MDCCLSCFGKSRSNDGEREPLLPHDSPRQESSRDLSQSASSTVVNPERPAVDKIVDVLAAFNAGKLPTQDQISKFLQVLLKSELLRDLQDKGKVVPGYGPLSKDGRKVLADVRFLIQAALQFGIEKNEDNKLQELYFQLVQMDVPPVEVNVDKPTAYKASQAALDKAKEGASELVQEGPSKAEVAFVAQTFVSALRTLVESCVSSSAFRLILVDLISIARDQFADTAADVEHAAHDIEQTAAELEHNARQGNDVIVDAAEGRPELDVSASVSVSVDDVKKQGQQIIDKIKVAGESAKREWENVGEDVKVKAKQRTLDRMQQLMTQIQKDDASRSALRAILILVRKYSKTVFSASEVVSTTSEKTVAETQNVLNEESGSEPPQQRKRPLLDVTADALLKDFKIVLERLGQGHSLDGVLLALSCVMHDLEDLPTILVEEVDEKIAEKTSEPTPALKIDTELSPTLSSPTPTPSTPQLSKSQKKKLKKKQRALEKAREAALPSTPTSAEPEAISPTEPQSEEQALADASAPLEPEGTVEPGSVNTGNPLRAYFSRVGEYFDKSLEGDWAASSEGMETLEGLFDDGVELTHVVSESVAEVGKELSGPTSSAGGVTKITTQLLKEQENELRRKFKIDLTALKDELNAFIASLENDKTTMTLLRAYDKLGVDLFELIRQEAEKKTGAASSWPSWLGWGIPRILSMIPSGALPIPSLEVKIGKMEAALRPLFARGVGRTSKLGTSLMPDEVVLQEWTEMRIGMADHGPGNQDNAQSPDVQATSRMRMRMDGIRGRMEGMGYYFKYQGKVVGYEDEGVLSVDAGMDGVHDGLEVDVEVEVANENAEGQEPEDAEPPKASLPEIIVQDANAGDTPESAVEGVQVDTNGDEVQRSAPADPLFRVMDVTVAMHGLRFRIDESKHWIINKLLVQPLAGPVVARLVKKALEEKVKTLLESLALGLGEVSREAKRRGDERRTRAAKEAVFGRTGAARETPRPTASEAEAEMVLVKEAEGLVHVLGDWWRAMLHTGPSVLGKAGKELTGGEEEGQEAQTRSNLQASTSGLIYTSASSSRKITPVQDQLQETPAMVYRPETKSFKRVDLSQIRGAQARDEQEIAAEEEGREGVTIAFGGAQLFPGKAGAPADQGVVEGIKDNVQGVVDRTGKELRQGMGMVERVEERWDERVREETNAMPRKDSPTSSLKVTAWQSDAFDW